jgi:hypothetical protein
MTSPAANLSASMLPQRIVASWNAISTRWNPVAVIIAVYVVLARTAGILSRL